VRKTSKSMFPVINHTCGFVRHCLIVGPLGVQKVGKGRVYSSNALRDYSLKE